MPGIGRVSRPSLLARAALLLVALACVGCGPWGTDVEGDRPTIGPERHVEVAGAVVSKHNGVEGSAAYTDFAFDDGRTYRSEGEAPEPAVGDLLLAGSKPGPWVDRAPLKDPRSWPTGCYGLGEGGYELQTTVQLDSGLILEKAPNYSRPGKGSRLFGLVLCLDKQGRVFEIVG